MFDTPLGPIPIYPGWEPPFKMSESAPEFNFPFVTMLIYQALIT